MSKSLEEKQALKNQAQLKKEAEAFKDKAKQAIKDHDEAVSRNS